MSAKVVGILGGMGPAATLDLFAKLLDIAQAQPDQPRIRVLIDCNPFVPERRIGGDPGSSPGPVLAGMAQALERAGAELLAMACNTAHAWQSDIEAGVGIPFVSMIEAVAAQTGDVGVAGVLAADACLQGQLYDQALARRGVRCLSLSSAGQASFMALLQRIAAGDTGEDVRRQMRALADELIAAGADVLIAGCTEVPLVLSQADVARPLIGSTDALAARVVELAVANRA